MTDARYYKRERVFKRFKNLLEKHVKFSDEKLDVVCNNIERGIFNHALLRYKKEFGVTTKWDHLFQWLYINRAVTLYNNLNPESYIGDTGLLKRFENSEFTDIDLAGFNYEEMAPGRFDALKSSVDEFMTAMPIMDNDGAHKCGRCKKYTTSYYELLTKSGDESTTIFVSCKCGHKWKYC